jgi:hypothetical protein
MATVMQMRWRGVTAEEYEAVCARLDWDSLPGRGAIAHVAGIDEDGLNVTDVWESAEHFQRFLEETLRPITEELGVGEGRPPEVRMFEAIRGWSRERAAAA